MKKIILVISLLPIFAQAVELSFMDDFSVVSEAEIPLTSFLSVSNDGSLVVKRDTNYKDGDVSIYKYVECSYGNRKYACTPDMFHQKPVELNEGLIGEKLSGCMNSRDSEYFVYLFSNNKYVVVSDKFKLERLWILEIESCKKINLIPQDKSGTNLSNGSDVAFFLGSSDDTIFYIYRSRDSSTWDGISGYDVDKNEFLKENYFSELFGIWKEHAVIAFSESGLLGGLYSERAEDKDLYCFFKKIEVGFKRESCHDILSLNNDRGGYVYASSALSKNGKYFVVGFFNYESRGFYVRVYKVLYE